MNARRCNYMVHDDAAPRGQRECGEPATQRINSARRFYYCDTHASEARDNYRRMGRKIDIVSIPEHEQ